MVEYLGAFWSKFWSDDAGAVIGSEYMILGTVVVLGSVSGLAAMRDATVDEMSEYGNSLRAVRHAYGARQQPSASMGQQPPGTGVALPQRSSAGADYVVP